MILSFRPEFVAPTKAGTKIHSMREDKHRRWRPGLKIQFATGARTKNYKQFMEGECKSVQEVDIYRGSRDVMVLVDNRQLTDPEILQLAKNDGFKDIKGMRDFFIPQEPVYGHDLEEWHGRIIHWTDKKY